MNKIYYSDGKCSIEAQGAVGIEIQYKGAIEINDKTPEGYEIFANNNKIIIIKLNNVQGDLSDLFEYEGYFKIISIIVSDQYGNKIPTGIRTDTDIIDNMGSNIDEITLLTEDLNKGYTSARVQEKTSLKHQIIKNLHTSTYNLDLFLADGSEYSGYFHIHKGGGAMTGKDHDEGSRDLFYKRKNQKKLTSTEVNILSKAPSRTGGY